MRWLLPLLFLIGSPAIAQIAESESQEHLTETVEVAPEEESETSPSESADQPSLNQWYLKPDIEVIADDMRRVMDDATPTATPPPENQVDSLFNGERTWELDLPPIETVDTRSPNRRFGPGALDFNDRINRDIRISQPDSSYERTNYTGLVLGAVGFAAIMAYFFFKPNIRGMLDRMSMMKHAHFANYLIILGAGTIAAGCLFMDGGSGSLTQDLLRGREIVNTDIEARWFVGIGVGMLLWGLLRRLNTSAS